MTDQHQDIWHGLPTCYPDTEHEEMIVWHGSPNKPVVDASCCPTRERGFEDIRMRRDHLMRVQTPQHSFAVRAAPTRGSQGAASQAAVEQSVGLLLHLSL